MGIDLNALVLNFLHEMNELGTSRYDLTEPCSRRVSPFRDENVLPRAGDKFQSRDGKSGHAVRSNPSPKRSVHGRQGTISEGKVQRQFCKRLVFVFLVFTRKFETW